MPGMAAVIMLLGANMTNWEDIKPHFNDRRESIVFLASFLSVLLLDLFGAVIVGSVLAMRLLQVGGGASEHQPHRQQAEDPRQPLPRLAAGDRGDLPPDRRTAADGKRRTGRRRDRPDRRKESEF